MSWYTSVLKQYAVFDGRARRQEYWMYTLFNVIIAIVLEVLAQASSFFLILLYIYFLAVLVPTIGVFIRRMHDTGRSGFWIWLGLIPFVGGIILLVFTCLPGDPGPNNYGADPKAIAQ